MPGNVTGENKLKAITLKSSEYVDTDGITTGGQEFSPYSGGEDADMTSKVREAFDRKYKNKKGKLDETTKKLVNTLLANVSEEEGKKILAQYNIKKEDLVVDSEPDTLKEEENFVKEIESINKVSNKNNEGGTEMGDEKLRGAVGKFTESLVGSVMDAVMKKKGQVTTVDQPPLEKPSQKSVRLPEENEQEELTTSAPEAESTGTAKDSITVAGFKLNDRVYVTAVKKQYKIIALEKDELLLEGNNGDILSVGNEDVTKLGIIKPKSAKEVVSQQAETGDAPEGKEEKVKQVAPTAVDSDNKDAKTDKENTDEEGAGRVKTDEDSGSLEVKGKATKKGQQAELGAEGETGEGDMSVEKKNLGDVKTPEIDVKSPTIEQQKNQRSVKEETEENQTETTRDRGTVDSTLPDPRTTSKPTDEIQDKIYLTAFKEDKTNKLNSRWIVASVKDKKPIFSVSLEQAFGNGIEAVKEYKKFASKEYKEGLEVDLHRKGAKRVIDEWFTDEKGKVYVDFVKKGQYAESFGGEDVGFDEEPNLSANPVVTNGQPNMNVNPEVDNALVEPEKKETPIIDLVGEVLAPIIAGSEKYEVNDVVEQLSAYFSDEGAVETFRGSLDEKVNTFKEELGDSGNIEEASPESVELKKWAKKITAGQYSQKFVELFGKITSAEGAKAKLIDLYRKIKAENKVLTAKVETFEAKEHLRKVAVVVKDMVDRGLLKREAIKTKVSELNKLSPSALNEFESIVKGTEKPIVKEVIKEDATRNVLLADANEDVNIIGKDTMREVAEGLFDNPPEVNEDNWRNAKKEDK